MAATEKEALKTLGDPMIWITPKADAGDAEPGDKLVPVQEAFEVIELPDDGPFTLVCEVEVRPEFDLPVLEGIPVERPKITIGEDDVTEQIDRIRSTRGSWEPVEDGPIEADDLVVVDLKMTVDGETITETENAQVAARPQVVENVILEKLGEALISKQVGDVCTTEGQIAEDDAREKLRGKKASFELTVQDIKRLSLPPLDEAFLTSMGFETEEELRKLFREQLEARLDQTLQSGMRNQVQRYLLDNTKLELPEQLSMRQTDRAVTRRMLELQSQGVPKEEIDKHLDEMKTQTSEQVADELKLQFIMDAAAEDAEVEVTEEDLNNEIAVMARQYNVRFDRIRDELAKGDGLSNLYIRIRDTKILDDLIEDAKITEIDGPDKTAEADKSKDAGKKTKAEKKTKKKATKKATSKSDDADAT
jgi:trigger factor